MNRFTRVIRATQVMPVSKANYQVCVCLHWASLHNKGILSKFCMFSCVSERFRKCAYSFLSFFHALGPCASNTLLLCGNVCLTYSYWHYRSAKTVCLCTFEASYCCMTIHLTYAVSVFDMTGFVFAFKFFTHDFDWWWQCPSKGKLSKRSFLFMHIVSLIFFFLELSR